MQIRIFIITLFLLFFAANNVYSQVDAESEANLLAEDEDTSGELFIVSFKPIFGLGQGLFSFYGDVRNNYNTPLVGQWGTSVNISRSLGRYLDFDLYAVFGKTSGEQRSLDSLELNRNFQSSLFVGGVSLSYNFINLFKRKRPIMPFIGVGIEAIQFQPRGDLRNENGNYFYHTDGSIRDADNNIIMRDYNYETNLREVNTLNNAYALMTVAVPLDFGLNLTVTDRLTLRLGNSIKFTFSDYVDDVQEKGTGFYKNDIINYTYAALRLDLFSPADEIAAVDQFKNVRYTITDYEDEDGDGVDDFNDECQGTQSGVIVDNRGCPLDADKDGVPDYRDEQPNSPNDAIVGVNGVRFTVYHLISLLFDPKAVNRKDLNTYYSEQRQQPRKKYEKMPDKFKQVDSNNDGWISPAEMREAIDKVFDFNSSLTIDDVNELLEYFWVQ